MKFKIGDKVKILPSAVDGGVSRTEVGTIQTVIKIIDPAVPILDITSSDSGSWWVYPDQIVPAIKVGQQLLLWDDILEE